MFRVRTPSPKYIIYNVLTNSVKPTETMCDYSDFLIMSFENLTLYIYIYIYIKNLIYYNLLNYL